MNDSAPINGNILVAKDLHKTYTMGKTTVQVLKGIDLEIAEGHIVAIVGPSGVGKSTLLQILGTLDRPTQGRVEINRTNVFDFDDKKLAYFRSKTIGFVFQFHHLLPEFSALENVMMPALIAGQPKNKIVQRAKYLLQEVRLEHRVNHRPSELSGRQVIWTRLRAARYTSCFGS